MSLNKAKLFLFAMMVAMPAVADHESPRSMADALRPVAETSSGALAAFLDDNYKLGVPFQILLKRASAPNANLDDRNLLYKYAGSLIREDSNYIKPGRFEKIDAAARDHAKATDPSLRVFLAALSQTQSAKLTTDAIAGGVGSRAVALKNFEQDLRNQSPKQCRQHCSALRSRNMLEQALACASVCDSVDALNSGRNDSLSGLLHRR